MSGVISAKIKRKIEELRSDYTRIAGKPFSHFYCPILFKDEDVPLCQAHIVNKAFAGSSKAWTVQCEDVDNFYGSNFEADFELLQYPKSQSKTTADIFMDKALHKKFDPKILVEGIETGYFIAQRSVPQQFTPIEFEKDGQSIIVGLKMAPDAVIAASEGEWELDVSKDIRIAALVSLIKAAHLTLFDVLGYRYVLSAAGEFVGRQILGEFYSQNSGKPKANVLQNAVLFFREFANMVRPVLSSGFDFQGSITDKMFLICWGSSGNAWAIIVFIRTGTLLHAVMLPVYDRADMVSTYIDFLRNQRDSISVALCRYEKGQEHWKINKEPTRLEWPKTGVLYP